MAQAVADWTAGQIVPRIPRLQSFLAFPAPEIAPRSGREGSRGTITE